MRTACAIAGGTRIAAALPCMLPWPAHAAEPCDPEHVFHMGGAMFMDGKGGISIGKGDNCHWNPGLPVDAPAPGLKWIEFKP